ASVRFDRSAEVDVLGVHEEPFVEEADRFGVRAPYEQARAAHPIRRMAAARQSIDEYRTLVANPLSQLVEGSDHPAVRQFRTAVGVDQTRPDDGGVRIVVQLSEQTIDGARGDDCVAVQQ